MFRPLSLLLVLLLSLQNPLWAKESKPDCAPTPKVLPKHFSADAERIKCELDLKLECHRHFPHEFQRNLYMRKCGEADRTPNPRELLELCDLMIVSAFVETGISLGEAAAAGIVGAVMYLRHSTPTQVARDFGRATVKITRSALVLAETAACLQQPMCVGELTQKFMKDLKTPGSESRKAFSLILASAKTSLMDNVSYVQCLNPDAYAAYQCSAAISAFFSVAQVKTVIEASK